MQKETRGFATAFPPKTEIQPAEGDGVKVLITGGAGFIGLNAADYFRRKGFEVVTFDNLSRRGTWENLAWLRRQGPVTHFQGDIRNFKEISACVKACGKLDLVLHMAAQVAVTTSVTNPREDFETNALGTFNLLEALRLSGRKPVLIYASTNKVYGGMETERIVERDGRYAYADLPDGVSEEQPLDFHSPYGCSKGTADQYVRDYARIYGLPTVVFRQSCIYGEHQFGVENQGWVAWLIIAAALDLPITIYGDGKQARDVLYITDLIRAFELAFQKADQVGGKVYNIGGGPYLQLSLLELLEILRRKLRKPLVPGFSDWRPGDQKVYISDIRKAQKELGWQPEASVERGVDRLIDWVQANQELLKGILSQS